MALGSSRPRMCRYRRLDQRYSHKNCECSNLSKGPLQLAMLRGRNHQRLDRTTGDGTSRLSRTALQIGPVKVARRRTSVNRSGVNVGQERLHGRTDVGNGPLTRERRATFSPEVADESVLDAMPFHDVRRNAQLSRLVLVVRAPFIGAYFSRGRRHRHDCGQFGPYRSSS